MLSIHHVLTQAKKLAAHLDDIDFRPSTYQLICVMSALPNSGHGLFLQVVDLLEPEVLNEMPQIEQDGVENLDEEENQGVEFGYGFNQLIS